MKKRVDITDQKYGSLTVRCRSGRDWICDCDCGGEIVTRARNLYSGNTRSCGCLGLYGGKTVEDIAGILGCDRRVVRAIEQKALAKLRRGVERHGIPYDIFLTVLRGWDQLEAA